MFPILQHLGVGCFAINPICISQPDATPVSDRLYRARLVTDCCAGLEMPTYSLCLCLKRLRVETLCNVLKIPLRRWYPLL